MPLTLEADILMVSTELLENSAQSRLGHQTWGREPGMSGRNGVPTPLPVLLRGSNACCNNVATHSIRPVPPPTTTLLKGLLPSIFCPFKNWQLDFIELLQSGFRVPGKY